MRKLAFLVAAGCVFGLGPLASKLGLITGSACSITLAILLACAASGGPFALAITSGALGAFGHGILSNVSTAVAGACLVGLAFAERTLRVRAPTAKAAHLAVALVGGALAGTLSSTYEAASLPVRAVAILVAAVLVALPLLIDADEPIAHALEDSALLLHDSVARSLREGASLRRHVDDALVDRDTRRSVARTWRSLMRLTEARVRLERMRAAGISGIRPEPGEATGTLSPTDAVTKMLDQKIADHIAALVRAYTAVDTAHAAELGLDDSDARHVDATGETLEDLSRAYVEVKA